MMNPNVPASLDFRSTPRVHGQYHRRQSTWKKNKSHKKESKIVKYYEMYFNTAVSLTERGSRVRREPEKSYNREDLPSKKEPRHSARGRRTRTGVARSGRNGRRGARSVSAAAARRRGPLAGGPARARPAARGRPSPRRGAPRRTSVPAAPLSDQRVRFFRY